MRNASVRQVLASGTAILFVSIFISCSGQPAKEPEAAEQPAAPSIADQPVHHPDTLYLFEDSISIGRRGWNRVLLTALMADDTSRVADLRFYSKKGNEWRQRSAYRQEFWGDNDLSPQVLDFNGDGRNDLLYMKGTGARGANVLGDLFIYDQKGDSLVLVRNSDQHPNLYYNRETSSINSWLVAGGNTTLFMRLRGDSLRPFASVYIDDFLVTVDQWDKSGKRETILEDSARKYDFYGRFINFRPLRQEKTK